MGAKGEVGLEPVGKASSASFGSTLPWNLRRGPLKRTVVYKGPLFRFHVNLGVYTLQFGFVEAQEEALATEGPQGRRVQIKPMSSSEEAWCCKVLGFGLGGLGFGASDVQDKLLGLKMCWVSN